MEKTRQIKQRSTKRKFRVSDCFAVITGFINHRFHRLTQIFGMLSHAVLEGDSRVEFLSHGFGATYGVAVAEMVFPAEAQRRRVFCHTDLVSATPPRFLSGRLAMVGRVALNAPPCMGGVASCRANKMINKERKLR